MKEIFSQLENCLQTQFVYRSEIQEIVDHLAALEARIIAVEKDNCQPAKEIYSVKDLAELLSCDAATVRRTYIGEGRIKASMNNGAYEIGKEEYLRVEDTLFRLGRSYI
jgi:hypothetical protein